LKNSGSCSLLRVKSVLLVSLFVVSTGIVGLTFVYPPLDDLWVENPFWNGLSKVYSRLDPVRLEDLASLEMVVPVPSDATVLMLGPSKPFTSEEVEVVKEFLSRGGTVVLADEFGTGNSLLEGLGMDIRFSGLLLLDPLFKDRNSKMPRILNIKSSEYTEGVDELVLNYPTVLNNTEGAEVLAWATAFSYLSEVPGPPGDDSATGPFPVVALVEFGAGRLLLVADSSIFINSVLDRGDNMAFLRSSSRGIVFIDEAHSIPSRLTMVKAFLVQVHSVLGLTEIKYGLTLSSLLVIAKINWGIEEGDKEEDEVEAVMRRHPEWDRGLLEELYEDRRRARGDR